MPIIKYFVGPVMAGLTLILAKKKVDMRQTLRRKVDDLSKDVEELTSFVVGSKPHAPNYYPATLGLAGRLEIVEKKIETMLTILNKIDKKV
jgi:hypothetical protein